MTDPIHADDDGGAGPIVVLLHAFPCDARIWAPQAAHLRNEGFRVIVPDLPGFGRSAPLPGPPSLTAVADAVVADLRARGVDRCVIGGVSLGGYVTMAILRQHSGLATGIVLADTKASADEEPARANRERLARLCEESPAETGRILEQAVLPGLLGATTHAERPEVVELVRGWITSAPGTSVAWYQRAMADRPDSLAALASSSLPALIVWGTEDVLSPRDEQDLMRGALAGATFVEVDRAGHLANVERPEIVSAALADFARSLVPG
jgi:pimeloyl-ACP methyl ester carboxylesterase